MAKCQVTHCEEPQLVMSGVDAIVLRTVTERFCYKCANSYREILEYMEGLIGKSAWTQDEPQAEPALQPVQTTV